MPRDQFFKKEAFISQKVQNENKTQIPVKTEQKNNIFSRWESTENEYNSMRKEVMLILDSEI